MSILRWMFMLAAVGLFGGCCTVTMSEPAVFRVTFAPEIGMDAEYGQGAIERCDALHRPLSDREWVIVDDERRPAADWERRLNDAAGGTGRFHVADADVDLRRKVATGEIVLQR